MSITLKELQDERDVLKGDFETLSGRIKSVENELGQMKSNLNVYGAIQQVDKLIKNHMINKRNNYNRKTRWCWETTSLNINKLMDKEIDKFFEDISNNTANTGMFGDIDEVEEDLDTGKDPKN